MKKALIIITLLFFCFNGFSQTVDSLSATFTDIKPNAFPTNFTENNLKKLKKWSDKIIAFDGEIIRVEKSRRNAPYYEVKIGDNSIWIISMIDSGIEKIGNNVRLIGHLFPIDEIGSNYEKQFHNYDFHVIVFGVVDMKTKKLAYFSSSEAQVKEWRNGTIPGSEDE